MTARPTARPIATPLARPIAGVADSLGSLFLDLYSGAAAAYSLSKLRNGYAGACLRVRRSSDNTEQDIGFVNNAIDTASLLAFCGSGSGFVTNWYDQASSKNAIQATTTRQPRIVNSGVFDSGLVFDGVSQVLAATSTGPASGATVVCSVRTTATNLQVAISEPWFLLGSSAGNGISIAYNSGGGQIANISAGAVANGQWRQLAVTLSGSDLLLYRDGALVASGTLTGTPSGTAGSLILGALFTGSALYWNGTIDDACFFTEAKTAAEIAAMYAFLGAS